MALSAINTVRLAAPGLLPVIPQVLPKDSLRQKGLGSSIATHSRGNAGALSGNRSIKWRDGWRRVNFSSSLALPDLVDVTPAIPGRSLDILGSGQVLELAESADVTEVDADPPQGSIKLGDLEPERVTYAFEQWAGVEEGEDEEAEKKRKEGLVALMAVREAEDRCRAAFDELRRAQQRLESARLIAAELQSVPITFERGAQHTAEESDEYEFFEEGSTGGWLGSEYEEEAFAMAEARQAMSSVAFEHAQDVLKERLKEAHVQTRVIDQHIDLLDCGGQYQVASWVADEIAGISAVKAGGNSGMRVPSVELAMRDREAIQFLQHLPYDEVLRVRVVVPPRPSLPSLRSPTSSHMPGGGASWRAVETSPGTCAYLQEKGSIDDKFSDSDLYPFSDFSGNPEWASKKELENVPVDSGALGWHQGGSEKERPSPPAAGLGTGRLWSLSHKFRLTKPSRGGSRQTGAEPVSHFKNDDGVQEWEGTSLKSQTLLPLPEKPLPKLAAPAKAPSPALLGPGEELDRSDASCRQYAAGRPVSKLKWLMLCSLCGAVAGVMVWRFEAAVLAKDVYVILLAAMALVAAAGVVGVVPPLRKQRHLLGPANRNVHNLRADLRTGGRPWAQVILNLGILAATLSTSTLLAFIVKGLYTVVTAVISVATTTLSHLVGRASVAALASQKIAEGVGTLMAGDMVMSATPFVLAAAAWGLFLFSLTLGLASASLVLISFTGRPGLDSST